MRKTIAIPPTRTMATAARRMKVGLLHHNVWRGIVLSTAVVAVAAAVLPSVEGWTMPIPNMPTTAMSKTRRTTRTALKTRHIISLNCKNRSRKRNFGSSSSLLATASSPSADPTTLSPQQKSASFDDELISSLDLIPLIEDIARHTATKRGYDMLLSLVNKKPSSTAPVLSSFSPSPSRSSSSASDRLKRQQKRFQLDSILAARAEQQRQRRQEQYLVPVASSVGEVHHAYKLTEEAMSLLNNSSSTEGTAATTIKYPPLYGMDSDPWDVTNSQVKSDDDEWLYLPALDWTVEDLFHAEQVLRRLLEVKRWGVRPVNQQNDDRTDNGAKKYNPIISQEQKDHSGAESKSLLLHKMAQSIDPNDEIRDVFDIVKGTSEIVRVKSATDPTGTKSYQMKLRLEKFPVLKLLYDQRSNMLKRGAKEFDKDLIDIQAEIDATTQQIVEDLGQNILSVSDTIQDGLDIISSLDVIMAKAAYGIKLNGKIPIVETNGKISVKDFVHPVLVGQAADPDSVVPIDLQLSAIENKQRALIISGANGGGKTAALKSFGLVSIMTKLGIPIPLATNSFSPDSQNQPPPQVDYFDDVIANIGDRQNLMGGESTWTSIVNSCAKTISRLSDTQQNIPGYRWLVLLDEFGTGTDPEAGGAIAQAVLEEILSVPTSSVIATTHSPRLKSLSFDDPCYGCASVLLQEASNSDGLEDLSGELKFKRPGFKLEYGIIGESYALGAASRSRPPLPPRVLTRASDILSQSGGQDGEESSNGQYILSLTRSMEKQLQMHESTLNELEHSLENTRECQRATVALAGSFQTYIDRIDGRLAEVYQKLKDCADPVEIIGDTISQVRIVKKEVMSQKEKLASQGLRMIPSDRDLKPGESVVIVSEGGKWDGISAHVIADSSTDSTLKSTEILVKPSFAMEAWSWGDEDVLKNDFDPIKDRHLIVPRHELAEWISINTEFESETVTSVSDSKQKLNSLLSSLNSVSATTKKKAGASNKTTSNNSFRSSRERKSSKKKKK